MLEGIKRTCGKEVPAEWQARGELEISLFISIFIIKSLIIRNEILIYNVLKKYFLVDTPREFSFGFCFGVLCLSVIFVLIATILCVLDHFNPEPEKEEADPEKDG